MNPPTFNKLYVTRNGLSVPIRELLRDTQVRKDFFLSGKSKPHVDLVGQFGGETGVINVTTGGVAISNMHLGRETWVPNFGMRGILKNDFKKLSDMDISELLKIMKLPGAHFGQSEFKIMIDRAVGEEIIRQLLRHNVRIFYLIGGNSTAKIAKLLEDIAKEMNAGITFVHICKTIDNDNLIGDNDPGFGTAALNLIIQSLGLDQGNKSQGGVLVNIIMGRDASFLTAAAAMAGQDSKNAGPHLVYGPEKPFHWDAFLGDADNSLSERKRVHIALSEGAMVFVDGKSVRLAEIAAEEMGQMVQMDKFIGDINYSANGNIMAGHLQEFLSGRLHTNRVRVVQTGYSIRSPVIRSKVDEAEAFMVGVAAAVFANLDFGSGSVYIERTGSGDMFEARAKFCTLGQMTAGEGKKQMPDNFMNRKGNYPTEAYFDWLDPLVDGVTSFDKAMEKAPSMLNGSH